MKNKKKFQIIFSIVAILLIIPFLLIIGFWIYRAEDSYKNIMDANLSQVDFKKQHGCRCVGIVRDAVRVLVGFSKSLGSLLIQVLIISSVIGLIVGVVIFIKQKRK